ncbi:glycosyltransferase family 4 protein [Ornithinimicrobium panacihumi]|uniref:glycosyltransferase family 4 protein n=1 Tax=Ornithinimicrobium panacihumi TaxID=2008449 RepID=UPI003F88E592
MDLILPPPPGANVVTLHDMVSWDFRDESDPVRAAIDELRTADTVICVSQFTAQTAQERMGLNNTVVVPNGVSEDYFNATPLPAEIRRKMGLRDPYLLYAGGSAQRKNLAGLADAWRLVAHRRPDWQLALSGATNPGRLRLFEGLPRVVHLGRVADEYMVGLMAGAGAAVVPSLYEGFGLPALEAMAARVPLVASNRASLPEVIGDGGTLVDPTPEGLAEGIEFVTSSVAAVDSLCAVGLERARQFTWERSAADHAKVWASLA